jgi:hypothetical protein
MAGEQKNGIRVTVTTAQGYERVEGKATGYDNYGTALSPPTLEQMVDADIDAFEKYFKGLGNDSLALGERAAIKTYLWFKTHTESSDGEA